MRNKFEVAAQGGVIRGEREGSGPAIVFLHAGVTDRRMWEPQFKEFSTTHTAIAYDRRGFGQTTCSDTPFRHRDDLSAVLDHLGLASAILCGCSQGSSIAIDFTLSYPTRTNSLILIGATWPGAPWQEHTQKEVDLVAACDLAEQSQNLERINQLEAHLWLDGPAADNSRVDGRVRELFLEMNGNALAHPQLTKEQEPADATLTDIDCPTLLINGDLDFVMIQRHHATLKKEIAQSTAIEMPQTAHLPSLEQPELFNQHLRNFLSRLG